MGRRAARPLRIFPRTFRAKDGSFRIDAILPGRDVTLTARKEGLSPRTVKVEPETDSVDVLLGRGGRVRGRVCGTAWEMASRGDLVRARRGDLEPERRRPCDSSGRFVLENAETGLMTFARSWRFRNPGTAGRDLRMERAGPRAPSK